MKKYISLALAFLLALALTACGGDPKPTEQATSPYAFPVATADGYVLKLDADMAQVLEVLGKPTSYFEAASCAFDGLDKTYTYAGFTITTRPDGDKDYVNDILLTDDTVATAEGVHIGSSISDVTAAYGEQEPDGNALIYSREGVTLLFLLDGDKVMSIEYYPAVD